MTASFSAKPIVKIAEAWAEEHTVSTVCTVSNSPARIVRWLEAIFGKPRRSSRHHSFVWKLRPRLSGDVRDPCLPEIRFDRG